MFNPAGFVAERQSKGVGVTIPAELWTASINASLEPLSENRWRSNAGRRRTSSIRVLVPAVIEAVEARAATAPQPCPLWCFAQHADDDLQAAG